MRAFNIYIFSIQYNFIYIALFTMELSLGA